MFPKLDAEITSLRRNQSLGEESLPYRLELGQHRIKPKIKITMQKSKGLELFLNFPPSLCLFILAFCIP
jgi:hypothetical protein